MPEHQQTARSSPPTERVVTILKFLAQHPDQRFGLSELARRTGLDAFLLQAPARPAKSIAVDIDAERAQLTF